MLIAATRTFRDEESPASYDSYEAALARGTLLHPQEQSYIGSYYRGGGGLGEGWLRNGGGKGGGGGRDTPRPVPEGATKFGDYLGLS